MPLAETTASGLSPTDRARVLHVETLANAGDAGLGELLTLLDEPSWPVRRAVVVAISRMGEPAIEGLASILRTKRDDESRIAAVVDALVASRADVTSTLIALADDPNPAIVCDAAQVLGRRKTRSAVAKLSALVGHQDDNVGVAAIEALGRIGGAETVEALIAAVRSRNFFRTFAAIDALGRTGDPRAIEPIVALLDEPFYAPEAVRALGRSGSDAAIAPLATILAKPSDALVRIASIALTDLRDHLQATRGDAAIVMQVLRASADLVRAAERVGACVAGAVLSEQVAMAHVLAWLGERSAVLRLLDLLDGEESVAVAAESALAEIAADAAPFVIDAIRTSQSARRVRLLPLIGPSRSAVPALVLCLADKDPEVRARACDALARTGDTSVVTELFRLLGDREARVSPAAAAAIQSLGSQEARRLALHEARSADPPTRRAAIRILSYFGYPESLDLLIDALSDADERIREVAIMGLPLFRADRAFDALLVACTDASPKLRAAAMRALGSGTMTEPVVAAITSRLTDDDAWVRYYACQALGRLKVVDAAEAIMARMDDDAGQVRVGAVEALAQLGTPPAIAALARAAQSSDEDIRRAALVGLGMARRSEYMPVLLEAFASPDSTTRLIAISAIAEFDEDDVIAVLKRGARDSEEGVRSASVGFLSTRVSEAATAALIELLMEPHSHDRALAALAVAPDARLEGILLALETADAEAAPLLVAVLVRIRRESSFAAISAALTFDNVHARRAAISALAAARTKEANDAVRRACIDDPDPEVRRIGAASLRE